MKENNYIILYQALLIFRNEILNFVTIQLNNCYKNDLWTLGVKQAYGDRQFAVIEKRYERRYRIKLTNTTPIAKLDEFIDIGNLWPLIQYNWDTCFSKFFDNQELIEAMLREIINLRNQIAHP